jgi:hypothetical protein
VGKYKVGDKVLVEHEIAAVWDDGRITYSVPGTPVTIKATVREDDPSIKSNPSIKSKAKGEKSPAKRGGGRVRIGGSPLAQVFDER